MPINGIYGLMGGRLLLSTVCLSCHVSCYLTASCRLSVERYWMDKDPRTGFLGLDGYKRWVEWSLLSPS